MKHEKHLNIISFDIPFPPNYGGVIDVYYKIKALAKLGVKLHCHFFQYKGRKPSNELANICKEVHYYKRNRLKNPFKKGIPYIVKTRKSDELIRNLSNNNYPILFEGLHTCYYINHPKLENRTKIVRMHNIEHHYYHHLAENESNPIKKAFFKNESKNLKKYLPILGYADKIASISNEDTKFLNGLFNSKVFYLPAFHSNEELSKQKNLGDFALYNGNLSVNENIDAATFLIDKVFSDLNYKLIIAGKDASKKLKRKVIGKNNIEIINNPDDKTMNALFADAQIHVLPTFQNTGIKLKLINALYTGRYVVVNIPMVENTNLKSLCLIAKDSEELRYLILAHKDRIPEENYILHRKKILFNEYSNEKNAQKLISNIF